MSKRARASLRVANDRDFVRIFGMPRHQPWHAYVVDDGKLIWGIGGILSFDDRWYAFMKRTPGCRSKILMHKVAKMLFEDIDRERLIVYAIPQRDITGSAKYLKRLGFFRTRRRAFGTGVPGCEGEKIWVRPSWRQ